MRCAPSRAAACCVTCFRRIRPLPSFRRSQAGQTAVDRLARSIGDLQTIVREIKTKGASLECTEQPVNTGTAAGKCFLDMLGVFAEFETNFRRERQLEGIAKAKAAGVYKGRPPSIEAARVREMKAQGMRPVDIAKALKIGRASVYRVLAS